MLEPYKKIQMKKYLRFISFFLCFCSISLIANSMILDTYTWNNRLVVLITDNDQTNLEKQVKAFFEQNDCDINDRNLKLLHFLVGEPIIKELPESMHSKTGIWLVGYDGSVKDYSADAYLLSGLFDLIDKMPMRKGGMSSEPKCS